jgi:hypothetical protein
VCEWQGAAVEIAIASVGCPWCHAPTHVVREEWLIDVSVKNPYAAVFGRLGGLKGGPARAERLSARRRREIGRLAAMARWHGRRR